ncbi:MAG TPA: PqqD family protein [Gemmatimonadaceae bacterium]|nr:PqqD family protein [Gemmatimonadaceae bacterium]
MLPTRNEAVIYRTLSEGAVLFSLTDEVYFGLNAVAAEVWEMLPPRHTSLDSLCAALASRHPEVSAEDLRADVIELLTSLESFGLLLPAREPARHAPPRVATVETRLA